MAAPSLGSEPPTLRGRTRSGTSLVDAEREASKQAKRARATAPEGADLQPRHFLVAFDEPYRHVEVSLPTLRDYSCRTARVIERDPPVAHTADGHAVWRVPYGHAALKCWIRAMTFGEIDLGADVGMQELLALLRYEGIDAPSDLARRHSDEEAAKRLHLGLWASEKGTLQSSVKVTTEAVADALVRWPRIAKGMQDVANGAQVPSFTCSATRVWVRFAPRPRLRYGCDGKRDALYEYCASKPRPPPWLTRTLRLLGRLYCSLPLPQRQRTVLCFNLIDELVQQRLKTWFTQEHPCSHEMAVCVRKFANDVIQTTYAAGPRVGRNAGVGSKDANEELLFARACVSLAEWIVENQLALNVFFSGACSDDRGDTVERSALAKALKARRVRVVRWRERETAHDGAVTPLAFPPAFADEANDSEDGPCVLLSFEAHA